MRKALERQARALCRAELIKTVFSNDPVAAALGHAELDRAVEREWQSYIPKISGAKAPKPEPEKIESTPSAPEVEEMVQAFLAPGIERKARAICREELTRTLYPNNPVAAALAYETLDRAVDQEWKTYLPRVLRRGQRRARRTGEERTERRPAENRIQRPHA